jgi:hypothetical protein
VSNTKNISKLKRIDHFPTFNTKSKHRGKLISFVGLTKVNSTKLQPVKETDLIGNIMELIERGLYLFEYQDVLQMNTNIWIIRIIRIIFEWELYLLYNFFVLFSMVLTDENYFLLPYLEGF